MNYTLYFIIFLAFLAIAALIFILQRKKKGFHGMEKNQLHDLIQQGIVYEDDFINTYYTMLRNEGYMHVFGGYEKQAHDLLFTMIQESKGHKASLENILKQI